MTTTTPSGFCSKCNYYKNDLANAVRHVHPGSRKQ
jgi:hypothetical protein